METRVMITMSNEKLEIPKEEWDKIVEMWEINNE